MNAPGAIGRIALMVLSGTATLSLIGAIAETADTGPGALPAPVSQTPAPLPVDIAGTGDPRVIKPMTPIEPTVLPPPAPTERWLRALTYAVTALAGFAAAGLVVLLRIASALSRIADR